MSYLISVFAMQDITVLIAKIKSYVRNHVHKEVYVITENVSVNKVMLGLIVVNIYQDLTIVKKTVILMEFVYKVKSNYDVLKESVYVMMVIMEKTVNY